MDSALKSAGYTLDERDGIWIRQGYDCAADNGGTAFEERIADVIAKSSDLSVFSPELRAHCVDWDSRYHMSAERANLLRPLAMHLQGSILEIGAGCGVITRYMGELGGDILALEGNKRRAAITSSRNRNLANVSVVAERFADFQCDRKFDVITLIGVLKYANLFTVGPNPSLAMLEQARGLLKPGGLLIIAIENQLGLRYLAGAPEDHIGHPMYGIEDKYQSGQVHTFGRKTLNDMLAAAGFGVSSFLAPFPDYKLTTSVISESGFASPVFDSAALASQSVPFDPHLPRLLAFSPELVWPVLDRNGLALDMANSFLIAARNGTGTILDPDSLAWHFTTNRRPEYCKETLFVHASDNRIEVRSRQLGSAIHGSVVGSEVLSFKIEDISPYFPGVTLSTEIIALLSTENWSIRELANSFVKYLFVVEQIASQEGCGRQIRITSSGSLIPGRYFDLTPHNIVVDAQLQYRRIDQEWTFKSDISAGYLLFRTLINILTSTTRLGHSADLPDITPIGFIQAIFSGIGWSLREDELNKYVTQETQVRRDATGRDVGEQELFAWLKTGTLQRDNLFHKTEEQARQLTLLEAELVQRDTRITELALENQELIRKFSEQSDILKVSGAKAQLLKQTLTEREAEIISLIKSTAESNAQTISLRQHVDTLHGSTSWRLSSPLRFAGRQVWRARRIVQLMPAILKHGGGVDFTTRKTIDILRREGVAGVRLRLRDFALGLTGAADSIGHDQDQPAAIPATLPRERVTPWYVDPRIDREPAQTIDPAGSVAVHLLLDAASGSETVAERLTKIPGGLDLFVSIPEGQDAATVTEQLRRHLPHVNKLTVENNPLCEYPLAAMVAQFGKRLSRYTVIGHFHTSPISLKLQLGMPEQDVLSAVLGDEESTGQRITYFFSRLLSDTKVIFADSTPIVPPTPEQQAAEWDLVREHLGRYTPATPAECGKVVFTDDVMFWARSDALRDLLPLLGTDSIISPVAEQGDLLRALGRMAPAFANKYDGLYLRITQGDSVPDYRLYEDQQDFHAAILHDDIKVLAYYLPQFHPTPENDEWHGKGFTEWTKVRAANPLFEGHYQQHIPHRDIGYYLLDSPDTLRKQARMMHAAGVHGLVFYHYWFGGRMILEEPAQMLLRAPDISMPFCFCWANENWTRRWDGNEKEILLGQKYSSEDARAFIRYLIPFFQDPRYIRIDGRPVLYVYRPSDLPDAKIYVAVWQSECRAAGLPEPYLVSVLTRGATDPADFDMDAGVERVLHDWTAGAAPEIKNDLTRYAPINGTVISYDDVASYYSGQLDAKSFTYFRSLVPIWDNTARYGSEAYVVHGSTPQRFQDWMEASIRYSKAHLPADRRFIVVNAWNEWAEGAHLEPDTRYGYAYLNAVGRSLAGLPYTSQFSQKDEIPCELRLQIRFSDDVQKQLRGNAAVAARFMYVLSRSTIFGRCRVSVDPELADLTATLPTVAIQSDGIDFLLDFNKLAIFAPQTIEKLVETALANPGASIGPNAYPGDEPLVEVSANGAIRPEAAARLPMLLRPVNVSVYSTPNFRMRGDACCFSIVPNTIPQHRLPVVTTVIRIHHAADLTLLRNALSSLAAMQDCICKPLIAAQDVPEATIADLEVMLNDLPWYPGYEPVIDRYTSKDGRGDLRSVMLNESLRKISGTYAGILDYDDLLMPHAYSWLIKRMKETGKAVSFGRVYSTLYVYATGIAVQRRRGFEYGINYREFLQNNHAPIHSFLLDINKIDIISTEYFSDQKYMEDYYLTLQIFSDENCDWDALSIQEYIGDYIHSVDRSHTLAVNEDGARQQLAQSYEYQRDELRITTMQQRILNSKKSDT